MAKYTPDVAYIASIYPGQLPDIRRNYGPSRQNEGSGAQRSTLFHLDPVPRGKPACILEIYDSFESVLDVMGLSSQGDRRVKPRLARPVPVEEIVTDLMATWTGGLFNVPQDAKPGVMQIFPTEISIKAGKVQPSPVERRQMEETQSRYFEYLFTEGERLHKQNNWKEITDTMRLAADWLGYQREWSHRAIAAESGPCPFCTAIIPAAALVCPSCHMRVRALPPELAKLQLIGKEA